MSGVNGSAAPAAVDPVPSTSAEPTGQADEGRCRACPHPWAEHGALDARFCDATFAHSHDRGCICRPVARRA
ncbi:RGCVC family protein [Pseudonocardia sp. WMMC193]|uniref:RGCVC family protein n=1 Tax=Pseudonocardia sp. WMMC193 TaxID=2911965 RepID=UPI001F329B12|nr:RGCVC family protein [Pseudonocardia sp. WMMC193]MCF7552375.1 RGCVC family protein [Pseudonocardia sp. WMMC193]